MTKTRTVAALATVALLGAACATMGPPQRPAYTGTDRVGAVNPQMIVGRWQGRVLNPIEGESQAFEAVYDADGTVAVRTRDTQSGMNLAYEVLGRWSIEGEQIRQQMESVRETSGNPIGGMLARFASSLRDRVSGTANVYEASAQRVVLVSDQGQAQELTRMP